MLMLVTAMLMQFADGPRTVSGADVIGDPASWVTVNDYPPSALRAGESGTVGFTVTIGADGKPTDCRITASSGSPSLDSTACRVMIQRARFRSGAPARQYSRTIKWVLPAPTGPLTVTSAFPADVVVETETVIGVGGLVERCRVIAAPKTLADPCIGSPPGKREGQGFIKDGKPVKAVVRKRFSVTSTFVAP